MNSIVKSIIIAFVLFAVPSFATPRIAHTVHILSTKRYIFYFKVEKELIGGIIEVFDDAQQLVVTAKIDNVKNIVDFFFLPPGNYNIRIKKDAEEFTFSYVNHE